MGLFKTVEGWRKTLLILFNFDGFTWANGTVWLKAGLDPDRKKAVELHEAEHLAQMARDGKAWYMIKYTYYLIRYGYKNNPYEREAREKAGQI